jgi:tight adherence protein C
MSLTQFAVAIGVLVGLGCLAIYWGLVRHLAAETPQQRLDRLTISQHPLEDADLDLPFSERVLKPWLRRQLQVAGRLAPARNVEKVRQNLVRAGYPYSLTVLDFLGVKVLVATAMAVVSTYVLGLRRVPIFAALFFSAALGIISFLLPDFWLGGRVRRRKKEIARTLPEALDMLTICVDAGAGLDSAMLKISDKWRNAIANEFGKVVAEIRIGLTRREALQNMVLRTDVPDMAAFVAVLIQADQFGLSIANVLHTQSEQMRQRRWQRAEEEARKVPLKLLFPLIFMIFPAVLAVTLGPAVPTLLQVFGQLLNR